MHPLSTHPLDQALHLQPLSVHQFSGATSPAYANMVGPFGGVTAAVLLQPVMRHTQRLGMPVALTVNFAGPIADGPFQLHAEPVRTNRSTQHWVLSLRQNDAVVTTGTAVTALRRATWSAPERKAPHPLPPASALPRAATEGYPAWYSSYDMRFIRGALNWSDPQHETSDSETVMWVRDEPARPLDFPALASISDSFLPRVFFRRRQRVPIGTVSLTTFFHADEALLAAQAGRHVLACARGNNFHDGFFDQSGEVFSDGGQLLASTHQVVYYRE